MFEMWSSCCAYEPPYVIVLRCCECRKTTMVNTDSFKEVQKTYVILKDNVKVTCPNCGKSQPRNERYIPQEPQIIRNTYAPYAPKKGLFTRFIDSMANMTPEEILSISNQIAAYNTDFPDSSNE